MSIKRSIKISKVHPHDYKQILWLFLHSWKEWLNKNNKKTDIPYNNERTDKCLEYISDRCNECEGFIAEDISKKNEIVGYITYSKNWNNLHIDDLYVKDEYRKQGIASGLISDVYREATAQNYEYIHTDCDVDNIEVNALNIKMGFELVGTLKNYWDKDCNFYKRKV